MEKNLFISLIKWDENDVFIGELSRFDFLFCLFIFVFFYFEYHKHVLVENLLLLVTLGYCTQKYYLWTVLLSLKRALRVNYV